jgi:hypothetical protein
MSKWMGISMFALILTACSSMQPQTSSGSSESSQSSGTAEQSQYVVGLPGTDYSSAGGVAAP